MEGPDAPWKAYHKEKEELLFLFFLPIIISALCFFLLPFSFFLPRFFLAQYYLYADLDFFVNDGILLFLWAFVFIAFVFIGFVSYRYFRS
jgi:hypothetical protein